MSYGYVYVAQIAMGADFNQTVKAIAEAEAYPGPSLDHRLRSMYQPWYQERYEQSSDRGRSWQLECGYWNNFQIQPCSCKS